jgi:hypothetical protein
MMIKLQAANPHLQQLRTDKGWRLTLDIDEGQYDLFKDLPKYQDTILWITIEDKENG